jgi:hypothetical protein
LSAPRRFAFAFFIPFLKTDLLESQGLQGRGLPRIIGADKNDRVAQLDFHRAERLSIQTTCAFFAQVAIIVNFLF